MEKQITIWSLEEAQKLHVNSPELLRLLVDFLPKDQIVYDYGCGDGYILEGLAKENFRCKGVEGTPNITSISKFKDITEFDLSQPFNQFKELGTVLSFEVAEHLLPEQEDIFLENLIKQVKQYLIISWALEGQVGYGHNNCKNPTYVIPKITSFGFNYLKDQSLYFRNIAGSGPASWFKNTIYIFEKNG